MTPPSPRKLNWAALAAALAACLVLVAVGTALSLRHFYLADLPQIPERETLWSVGHPTGVTFLGPDGKVVAWRGPRHGAPVRLAELPQHVPLAFLAAEDRRFYQHGPVDLRGLLRAAKANVAAGRAVEGGSTLSQQLARTLFLKPDKTLKRKVQEAVLAHRLEAMLTKDEILELYLNRIYFGDGAYGLGAAARTYFDKSPAQLTLAEAAMLAALPKAPSRLAPTNDLPAAWGRARLVLGVLRDTRWLEPRLVEAAVAGGPPRLHAAPVRNEGDMAWAIDEAARQVQILVGQTAAPDLVVQLTVEPELQSEAASILRRRLGASGARQGAVVVLAPDGAIRAIVGGRDYAASPFNRALQARRQPGSAFKPIVWAAALESGVGPFDVKMDREVTIDGWSPRNYGGGHRGAVTVEKALRLSLNTVAAGLVRETGVDHVAELARRFGLANIPLHPGPSIALGAYEVSLLQLAGAYQVLQSGGGRVEPYIVSRIANARGDVLWARTPSAPVPVYGQYQAGQMVRMMEGVIQAGTGTRAALDRPAAGKTGTSQNYRDAWFVGFTPDWVCGVWVGDDHNRPMRGVTGGELPAEIWRAVMTSAHQGLPVRDFDWAPPLEPPQDDWSNDPYAADGPDAYVDAYDDGYVDAEGLPWREPRAPGGAGPTFADGYGRAREGREARIWTHEPGDDTPAEADQPPPRPAWPPGAPD